jgi:hypothetical protein
MVMISTRPPPRERGDHPGEIDMPQHKDADLLPYCKDLHEWAENWHGMPEDIPFGESIVETYKPFIRTLIKKQLATKTIQRHIDNLCRLGGEVIRLLHEDDDLRKLEPKTLLAQTVNEDGGTSCRHLDTDAARSSYDATCKKLHAFLSDGRR